MKNKKLAALALSSVMSLSLATPAFASDYSTRITSVYNQPVLAVTVPATGTATINPYGLPVKVMSQETDASQRKALATISNQKITTMPLAIYSKSEVNLLVGASVVGEPQGNLKLATAAIPANSTTNTALVYLETKTSTLTQTALAGENDTDKIGPFKGTTTSGSTTSPNTTVVKEIENWAPTTYNPSARNQAIVALEPTTGSPKIKTGIGYLTKADNSGNLARGGAMWFRLAGDVVANPKEAWTASDGVNVTVAFTFLPTESAGVPGVITNTGAADKAAPTAAELVTGVTFKIDAANTTTPPMTFSSETYYWEVVSAPDGANLAFDNGGADAEGVLKAAQASDAVSGDYQVKLTVTENNVPFVATYDFTIA